MKKNLFLALLISLALVFLQACVTPSGMAASNTPLTGKKITQKLGKGKGTSSKWSFSFLCSANYGHPNIYEATEAAIQSKQGGNALINVTWYTSEYCWLMAKYHKFHVEGDVVILSDDYENTKEK